MKKLLTILTLVMLFLTACGGGNKSEDTAGKESKGKKLKVGIVYSEAGLGDKAFNDSANRGMTKAEKDLGIEFKGMEPASLSESEQYLKQFAENGYDLIIGVGFTMKSSLEKVASEFPETKFAIIDETSDAKNVASLVFSEDEGSFLTGALAAMMSKTGTIGFIGGMDSPLIKKFEKGYKMGAEHVNPDVKVLVNYTGSFNDPVKGKETGLFQISSNADVLYHAAGGCGMGVIEAAKSKGKYAIGVDSNQDQMAEGVVLTSMLKNVDKVVYDLIETTQKGEFKAGVTRFGLADGGVGTTEFEFTKDVIGEENIATLEKIKQEIIDGKITGFEK